MKKLLLIRHGNTAWNEKEIFRGRADIELSDSGIKQAESLSSYLSETKPNTIYSSPLKRALKTAEAVSKTTSVDISIAPELTDLNFGEWQGMDSKQVSVKYKSIYNDWFNNPHLAKIPGGESLDEVRERVMNLVNSAKDLHETCIVFVSHRVVLKVIICALLGLDNSHFWNIRIDTCGITTFGYDGDRFILLSHNDTSFLEHGSRTEMKDF